MISGGKYMMQSVNFWVFPRAPSGSKIVILNVIELPSGGWDPSYRDRAQGSSRPSSGFTSQVCLPSQALQHVDRPVRSHAWLLTQTACQGLREFCRLALAVLDPALGVLQSLVCGAGEESVQ